MLQRCCGLGAMLASAVLLGKMQRICLLGSRFLWYLIACC